MRHILIFILVLSFCLTACQKTKWNRKLAVRSGKYKLTRYEVNEEDRTDLIPSFVIDFKNQDPGHGTITELITDQNYSKGYNSCFNIEGALNIPNEKSVTGLPIEIAFSAGSKIENSLAFLEVNHFEYGCTRSILPKILTRTKFVFEFPYNSSFSKADTSEIVRERYIFEKLP